MDDRLVEHRGLREHPHALHEEERLGEVAGGGPVPKGSAELHVLHLPLDILLGEIVGGASGRRRGDTPLESANRLLPHAVIEIHALVDERWVESAVHRGPVGGVTEREGGFRRDEGTGYASDLACNPAPHREGLPVPVFVELVLAGLP